MLAIYIRDISKGAHDAVAEKIIKKFQIQNILLLFCQPSEEAALYAARQGWIRAESVEKVYQDRVKDESR